MDQKHEHPFDPAISYAFEPSSSHALHSLPTVEESGSYQHDRTANGMPQVPARSTVQSSALGTDSQRPKSATSKHAGVRSALGLNAKAPIAEEHDRHPHHDLWWSRVRLVMREPFAEFWGVFIMVMFGDGSVAQVLLSEGLTSAPGGNGFGAYQSISWGCVPPFYDSI